MAAPTTTTSSPSSCDAPRPYARNSSPQTPSRRNAPKRAEALDAENAGLEARLGELARSRAALARRHADSKANVRRLSVAVVFAHEEISRLTMERGAESRVREEVEGRSIEMARECERRGEALREVWSENNALLLERESAAEAADRSRREGEKQSVRHSKERGELLEKVRQHRDVNERQRFQIKNMKETEGILREMNSLLVTEKEAAGKGCIRHGNRISTMMRQFLGWANGSEIN